MLSVTDQRALHGLARAFAADQEKQRGGKAANSKRKAVHCKLLELWSRSLTNLCSAMFDCPPARRPAFASKFVQIEGRRRQLSQQGFVVHKGTPLLPKTEESDSEDSAVGAPVDIADLESLSLEEFDAAAAPSAPSAPSSGSGSLERRSRSPVRSARADNRDLGSDVRGLDSFGRLSSGRPLPPEPPVAPPRPSGTSSAPLPKARPVQKARPKPPQPQPRQPHALLSEAIDKAQFGSEIGRAVRSGTVSPIDAILSLDFNGVLNRSRASSLELFRILNQRPRVFILVTSKCSTPSLITGATDYIAHLIRTSGYGVHTVPIFYCHRPTGSRGKCSLLYRALTVSGGDIPPVYHVREFEGWRSSGYRGVPVRQTDPRGLGQIVREKLEL